MLAFGKTWTTRFVVVSKHFGMISTKKDKVCVKRLLRLLNFTNQTKKYLRYSVQHMVHSKMRHNVRAFTVRILIAHVCFHVVDVQEANRNFSLKCRV